MTISRRGEAPPRTPGPPASHRPCRRRQHHREPRARRARRRHRGRGRPGRQPREGGSDLRAARRRRPSPISTPSSPTGRSTSSPSAAPRACTARRVSRRPPAGLHVLVEKADRHHHCARGRPHRGGAQGGRRARRVFPGSVQAGPRSAEASDGGRRAGQAAPRRRARAVVPPASSTYAASRWRGTRVLDGGGALMNQAIHTADLLIWLLGDVARVQARTATLLHGIEVEDSGAAILEFASGALGVLGFTTAAYPGYPRRLSGHRRPRHGRHRAGFRGGVGRRRGARPAASEPGGAGRGFRSRLVADRLGRRAAPGGHRRLRARPSEKGGRRDATGGMAVAAWPSSRRSTRRRGPAEPWR